MTDCNGASFYKGDVVVVAGRKGSSIWLKKYTVLDVEHKTGRPLLEITERKYNGWRARPSKLRHYWFNGNPSAIMIIESYSNAG